MTAPRQTAAKPAARTPSRSGARPQAPEAQRRNSAEDAPAEAGALARIAEAELRQRTAALKQAVDNGDWPGDPANETARLWLAIAAAAGAKLPEMQVPAIFPIGRTCTIMAHQIAEPSAYLAELARARDAAIAKAEAHPQDLRLDQRARDLIALADALKAPGRDWSPKGPSSSEAVGADKNAQRDAA